MATPLKDIYSEEFLWKFSEQLHRVDGTFDTAGFIAQVMDESWDELALKARMRQITQALGRYLPNSYEQALAVLFAIDEVCVGFPYLFFPDFVAVYGLTAEHWELSMMALERFTLGSSAEFAVRPFIMKDPIRMMGQMKKWASHSNEHVRRLASEGCRPRLPWGEALTIFKKDPLPVLEVLEILKADPALYVRKSVANNLNDISKDHPNLVLEIISRWKGVDTNTDWILRHGCRTLIRKADERALTLFGYGETAGGDLVTAATLVVHPSILPIGESCELTYELVVREGGSLRLRIEYGIYFVKARGQTARKLFLLSDKTVSGGTRLRATRKHRWADLTTRRHYPGQHRIVLVVNGQEVADTLLQLEDK